MLLKSWQRANLFSILLLPFSALYWCLLNAHRALYLFGLKPRHKATLPTIVVGNLTVGGTGKTPLVIHLVELLERQGYKPGVVSRAYKSSKQHGSFIVEPHMAASMVGDEPSLIARRTGVPVAIGANRHDSINLLQGQCDVVVCDDGLQHWPLEADVRLCISDASASGNSFLLPAGPWRELPSRMATMDIVVARGAEKDQPKQFFMQLEPSQPVNLVAQNEVFPRQQTIHAVAGIAQPKRFFDSCKALGFSIVEHAFSDHHQFVASDLDFDQDTVLMTEKDAVKCIEFAKPSYWYLPVKAKLSADFDAVLLTTLNKAIKTRS